MRSPLPRLLLGSLLAGSLLAGSLLAGSLLAGCASDEAATPCTPETERPACAPLYEPVWENVYERTLVVKCGTNSACHATGARGRIVFAEDTASYDALMHHGRVVPGAAACSKLARRLHGEGAPLMPPGVPVGEAEICAIEQWVHDGAER